MYYSLPLQILQILHLFGFEEFVNATEVLAHALVAELIDFGDKAVKEITVVAHDDEGSIEIDKGLLQDVLGLYVEMVGRLVEDKEVHRLKKEFEQCQSGALATREHLHLLHGFLGSTKHEGTEQVAYLVAHIALGHIIDGLEDGEILVEQRCLILGEVTNLHIVTEGEGAVMFKFVHDALDQCTLSFTVASDESHLVAALDGEGDVLKNDVGRPT